MTGGQDGERDEEDGDHQGDQDDPVHVGAGLGDGILHDLVGLLCDQVGRLVEVLLGDRQELGPADCPQGGVGDVGLLAVDLDEGKAAAALQGLVDQGHQLGVGAFLEALELVGGHAELSVLSGRIEDVAVFIDQAGVAGIAQLGLGDDVLEAGDQDGSAADGGQLPVDIDGHAGHDLVAVVVIIQVDGGKVGVPVDLGAHVPGPAPRIVGQDFAVLSHLSLGRAVGDDAGASRQGDHAVEQGVSALHDLQDHIAEAPDPEDLFFQFRIRLVRVLGVEELEGELAGLCLSGQGDREGGKGVRMLQDHPDLSGQDLQVVAHGPEFPVHDPGLGLDVFLKALRRHLPHGIGHGVHDDGVLLPVGLLHQGGKTAHLKNTGGSKQDHCSGYQQDVHPGDLGQKALLDRGLRLLPGVGLLFTGLSQIPDADIEETPVLLLSFSLLCFLPVGLLILYFIHGFIAIPCQAVFTLSANVEAPLL